MFEAGQSRLKERMELEEDPHLYDAEILRLERRIANLESQENLVAFYGSSSIRLWVHMLRDLEPLNLINLGFGGSSFTWCMHHFDRLFKDLEPKEMVIYAGDNDMGTGVPPEEVFKRYHKLKAMILDRYPEIFLHVMSVKPSPFRDYLIPGIKWLNTQFKEDAEMNPNMSYINVFDGLTDGHNPNTTYYLSDLLHLNRKGYAVWKKIVRAHFELDG